MLAFLNLIFSVSKENNATQENLTDEELIDLYDKKQLVKIIRGLQRNVEQLISHNKIEKRVIELEKSHYSSLQYSRRDTIEIDGIPEEVEANELESEVMKIIAKVGVNVNGDDFHAVHHLNHRGTATAKLRSRKTAWNILKNRK